MATDAFDVERAAVNLKPVGPVRSCLRCCRDSQARPYSHAGLLMIEPRDQCHGAITLKGFSPQCALQMICGVLFLLPLFHVASISEQADRLGSECGQINGFRYHLQSEAHFPTFKPLPQFDAGLRRRRAIKTRTDDLGRHEGVERRNRLMHFLAFLSISVSYQHFLEKHCSEAMLF